MEEKKRRYTTKVERSRIYKKLLVYVETVQAHMFGKHFITGFTAGKH